MSLDVSDDKTRATFRRLLLAKQLYIHGIDHSNKAGVLNKMVAIHNLHNAIEIALRAIFLQYEIRAEKTLNIDFESMLNEIDGHQDFKDKGIKLPYRQEVRNLNQIRNLVQHHAVEPEDSTMEDWRVFTQRFLQRVCETYFNLEFDKLSPLDMIDDPLLKSLFEKSISSIEKGNAQQSITVTKIAFEWASRAILEFLPQDKIQDQYVNGMGFIEFREVNEALHKATYYAALLSTGVHLVDYKQFLSSTPYVSFMLNGNPNVQWGRKQVDMETAKWTHEFAVTTIVHWQVLGLLPKVADRSKGAAQKIIGDDSVFA